MSMRISAFWTCYGYIERLRAEEILAKIPELQLQQADEEGFKSISQNLLHTIGNVSVEKEVFDADAWGLLKSLA